MIETERVWNLLLVDDDEDEYVLTRQMLLDSRARKSRLEWASSFNAGRQAMMKGGFDAVLMDYDLGHENGLSLIRESTARGDNVPIILFTARGSAEIDFQAMQAGAALYLTKSEANPLLLERAIRYAIERKQSERALAEANSLLTGQKAELEQKNDQLVQTLLALHERETGLRESEERFRGLFNGMTEGFALHEILCDPLGRPCDYRFLEVNPSFERLTGLKRDDIVGRLKTEVLPDDDPHWIEIYGQVALTGEPIHFEKYSPALKHHYDVYAYSPAPGQFATLFMNISERKQMEAAMREREAELRAFVRLAKKGFQEPLRAMLHIGEHLQQRAAAAQDEPSLNDLMTLHHTHLHIRSMIDGLLAYAQVVTDQDARETVDLPQLVSQLLKELQPALEEHQVQVQVGPLPAIQASHRQISLLVKTLLVTAIGLVQPGRPPRLAISARREPPLDDQNGQVKLILRAEGNCLDDEQLALLTGGGIEMQAQKESSWLALAVCRKIVERHQGRLEIENRPGEGAAFLVTLPERSESAR